MLVGRTYGARIVRRNGRLAAVATDAGEVAVAQLAEAVVRAFKTLFVSTNAQQGLLKVTYSKLSKRLSSIFKFAF